MANSSLAMVITFSSNETIPETNSGKNIPRSAIMTRKVAIDLTIVYLVKDLIDQRPRESRATNPDPYSSVPSREEKTS